MNLQSAIVALPHDCNLRPVLQEPGTTMQLQENAFMTLYDNLVSPETITQSSRYF